MRQARREIEALLHAAIEGRKRVKDQLLRIDSTYPAVRFTYIDQQGNEHAVTTLEEEIPSGLPPARHGGSRCNPVRKWPHRCKLRIPNRCAEARTGECGLHDGSSDHTNVEGTALGLPREPARRGFFDKLFGPYLVGAKRIIVTDPYLRMFHQQRNLMELLETISRNSNPKTKWLCTWSRWKTNSAATDRPRTSRRWQQRARLSASSFPGHTTRQAPSMTATSRRTMAGRSCLAVDSTCFSAELNDAFSFANRMHTGNARSSTSRS